MADCIFCKISSGEIAAKEVYRDEHVVAIEDLNPQAPAHLLVMPVRHHANVVTASNDDAALVGRIVAVASRLGAERGGEQGFRLVVNTGPDGGQTVEHLHVHVLAGRRMTWPPG
ncbi:MAG TPA: histidine triad nucleotide-binding protein [Candidatus Nitrosotalea sp.]|nr:histidine triad nucleotide-binding protein [Candidatus Nitrosotalea sp.]